MVALEIGNGSPVFKLLVQMLGLPCKFSKSTWCSHITKFKDLYEDVAEQVLGDSRGKISEVVEVDDNTGLTPLKIGYGGTWAKRGHKSLFGAGFAVALQTNEIIDFGTKSKLNESVAFAPFPKNSEKLNEHKAKVEASSEAVFTESSGAMEKKIVKTFLVNLKILVSSTLTFWMMVIRRLIMRSKIFMAYVMGVGSMRRKQERKRNNLMSAPKVSNSGKSTERRR